MIAIPIFGAILEAAGSVLDKKIIKNRNINFKNYSVYGFLSIVLVMLPFIYWFWKLWPEALTFPKIIIFSLIVIFSVIANLLMIYALKRESLTELEPVKLMQPLFTILIAFVLSFFFISYSEEKNLFLLILALIASLALIFSHVKKHHLVFDKYIIAALISNFLFGLELALSKYILPGFSQLKISLSYSFTFYILRCFFIFLICLIIFRPKFSSFPKKVILPTIIVSFIWAVYRVILYYGYATYGIIFTTILLSILAPLFIYIFAKIFLKEKLKIKNIIASIIIIICVILAVVFNGN
jgi:drug/metabolite transporter (DMT)-like permease